jgi:hypothetical protein
MLKELNNSDFKLFLRCVLILFPLGVFAQTPILLSGSVTDASTGKPLPYAAISVAGSTLGTTTNEDGAFHFAISGDRASDTVYVSYLGYKLYKEKVTNLVQPTLNIPLKPVSLLLSEVEVVGLTPVEVIRRVVAEIPANYGTDTLILTAFIRSQKMVNTRLAEFTEAVVEDLKTGYRLYKSGDLDRKRRDSNIPRLVKGRVVSDTLLVNAMGDAGREAGCLGCNFNYDVIEFYHHTILDEKTLRHYDLRMEEMSNPAGGKIYHIFYEQKAGVKERLWKGELFVESTTFALLKMTQRPSFNAWETYEKSKYKRTYFINNKPGWIADMPLIDRTVTYTQRNGRWYLSTIRDEERITFTLPSTGQRLRFSYKNEVVVTNVTNEPAIINSYRGDKSTGVGQRWDQVAGKPDPDFWSGFNYLPIEEALQLKVAGLHDGIIE